jgi:GT2 family glycosyltransferase
VKNESQWPRVSIVTPSCNQGRFLEETIRSVLLQDYPNLEYFIMDGGSTDSSVEIVRKYEPWLTYWESEQDRGQSHAINKGWQRATGEIVAWLNSDDTYAWDTIRNAASFFVSHPEVDMIYGNCSKVDENGSRIGECPTRPFDMRALVCNEWFISQPTVFMRRKVLEGVGPLNEGLHLVMDWELWLRVALAGFRIQHWADVTAGYRTWSGAKTQAKFERSACEKLQVLDWLFSTPDLPEDLRALRGRAYSSVHRFAASNHLEWDQPAEARKHLLQAVIRWPQCLLSSRTRAMIFFSWCDVRSVPPSV